MKNIKNYSSNKSRKKVIVISILTILLIALLTGLGFYISYLNQIKLISISSSPTDTEYYVGEELNLEGLSVQVVKNNGKFYFVDEDECEVSGFDSSAACENQKITISYEGFSTYFTVNIIDVPSEVKTIVGISIDVLPKTEYKVGESLDTTGGVLIREYKDGSTAKVSLINKYVYGFSSDIPGEYELTIVYYENGIYVETTYTITVVE